MSAEYHPREHDHLVEPLLAGLRSEAEAPRAGGWPGAWRAVRRLLAGIWRRRG